MARNRNTVRLPRKVVNDLIQAGANVQYTLNLAQSGLAAGRRATERVRGGRGNPEQGTRRGGRASHFAAAFGGQYRPEQPLIEGAPEGELAYDKLVRRAGNVARVSRHGHHVATTALDNADELLGRASGKVHTGRQALGGTMGTIALVRDITRPDSQFKTAATAFVKAYNAGRVGRKVDYVEIDREVADHVAEALGDIATGGRALNTLGPAATPARWMLGIGDQPSMVSRIASRFALGGMAKKPIAMAVGAWDAALMIRDIETALDTVGILAESMGMRWPGSNINERIARDPHVIDARGFDGRDADTPALGGGHNARPEPPSAPSYVVEAPRTEALGLPTGGVGGARPRVHSSVDGMRL